MPDTTRWRRDADRNRQTWLEAFRAGDMDHIAETVLVLEALLQREDRPAPPAAAAHHLSMIEMISQRSSK
jgi:hypothetical protein